MKIRSFFSIGLLAAAVALAGCDANDHRDRDITAPAVGEVSPAEGSDPIGATAVLSITFNEPLDPETVEQSTIVLEDSDGNPVAGTVSYDEQTCTVTFAPTVPLNSNATYTATVAPTVSDRVGNYMDEELSWSFTTTDFGPPAPPTP